MVTTMLPVTSPYSAGLQPSEVAPEPVLSTLIGSAPDGSDGAPLALIAWMPLPTPISTPGKVGTGSFAATEIAPSAVAGEPVMYWFAPLLPAEATTTTPALAALVEATADGSSAEPNDEPSDMLTTSMSLSTAQSSASTTTSVGPSQPNTRTA